VPNELPETDTLLAHPAAQRLVLALVISLAFHLAIVFLIRIAPAPVKPMNNVVIEVSLEEASRPAIKAAIAALEQKHAEEHLSPIQTAPTPTPPVEQKPAEARKSEPLPNAPLEQAKSSLPTLEVPLIEDPTFYPAKQLDVQPKSLAPISPVYPEKAASDNISGEVTLLLLIDETGKVHDLDVVDAKPEGQFEESALDAFRNTRWAPAQKDGRIVKARVLIRVRYDSGVSGARVGF
jgi:periplasmic protein TonB